MLLRAPAFALVTALLPALPAMAEPICDPAPGTSLSVTGVASNDTLNLRAGPSAQNALVTRIKPGEKGVTATGRAAWAKGQCNTTCSGEEGGLSDTGRSIAYGCKAKGKIWYEVKTSKGVKGWASAKFLIPASDDDMVIEPPTPPVPQVETRLNFTCAAAGKMEVAIYTGGQQATVKIGGKSYLVLRKSHAVLRYFFAAGDGARLRGNASLIEWRWPGGDKVNCVAG